MRELKDMGELMDNEDQQSDDMAFSPSCLIILAAATLWFVATAVMAYMLWWQ